MRVAAKHIIQHLDDEKVSALSKPCQAFEPAAFIVAPHCHGSGGDEALH